MSPIVPNAPIAVRAATLADIPFMDELQKRHGKALGYWPTRQFEEYVEMGAVLIAEAVRSQKSEVSEERIGSSPRLTSDLRPLTSPLGYLISRDRYLKRDELGVIYQLCVAPVAQRKLIGATLIKEVFQRSAYGCKLYCCWCAQDLAANHFWESLGFFPLAFRTGSDRKRRVHIFWQRRIGAEDAATPYWYPFTTNGGAIRADRLVFPIPPGVHWSEVKAVELPQERRSELGVRSSAKQLPAPSARAPKAERRVSGPGQVGILVGGRIRYVQRTGPVAPQAVAEPVPAPTPPTPAKVSKPKRPAAKIDRKYLAAARELRDRYLEYLNGEQFNAGVIEGVADGSRGLPNAKYEVARALPIAHRKACAELVQGSHIAGPNLLDAA